MEQNSHTVTLTRSMLRNGHIDLPMSAKHLFPADSFGSRAKGDEGLPVELLFGGQCAMTDLRIKSAETISPRRRMYQWLNTELRATVGDRIRVERLGVRQFSLKPVAA